MSRTVQIEDLHAIEIPGDPALSPDARRVAYVVSTADRDTDSPARRLWIADTDGRGAHPLTPGPDDSAPAWSPDGTRLAFLRHDEAGQQLWLLAVESGRMVRLTALPHGVGRPAWSPDGRRIALAAGVDTRPDDLRGNETGEFGALAARAAHRTHQPMVTDRLDYQSDGQPWRRDVRRHLHVLDVPGPSDPAGAEQPGVSPRRLTIGDWDASTPSWSPDGTRLAFTADLDPDADLTRTRVVCVIPVDDPADPRPVGPGDGHLGSVSWIDDRTLLAGGRTDTRTGHDCLWRIDETSGEAVNLTAALDRSIMRGSVGYPGAPPALVDGGRTILFCARDRGCTHLFEVPVAGGTPRLLVGGGGRVVAGMSAAGDRLVVVLTTPRSFGEVYAVERDTGAETACTSHGSALAGIELRERVEREFVISDGTRVHGWLLRAADAAGPQPLLLDIHGGPHNAWNGSSDPVHLYHQVLVERGWTVLILNPRASDGYGEAFYTATFGAWGEGDLADFLEPIDTLIAEDIADAARLAVTGYSYGGYMTCYLTAHDDRFAAAVPGGPITDLVSDCGTNDEGPYVSEAELGGCWWDDPEPYRRLSPLRAVASVVTPTLILQANDDARCPRGQAQQWFTALRQRRVPVRLVLYPEASHGFLFDGRPSHRVDYNERVIDWVERHAGSGSPDPADPGAAGSR
jgi:dipeptidyl aminopeptidase/acylaminoacyl peptidase